jgi:hypothetical protein
MMRRLFWAAAGALLGVSGYRRVSRLARAVTTSAARPPGRRGGRTQGRWARSVALFARDVRDGMELYTDRHPRLAGRTLEGQQARTERLYQASAGGDTGRVHPGVEYAKDGR